MKIVGRIRLFFLVFLGIVSLLIILYVRSYSDNSISKLYWLYAIIALSYVCSRILASLLYRTPDQKKFSAPFVTFLIPAYNEEKAISSTIRHCFEAYYPKDKLEVVVVNDGSTDNTWSEILKAKKIFPQLNAINLEKNVGKRDAMVQGIRASKGEVFVQLDSDSYLEKDSLIPLVSVLEDRKIAGVSAHTDPENKDENLLTRMQTAYYFLSFRFQKAAESALGLVFCCSGCCSAYRKEYVLPILDEWNSESHLGVKTIYGDDRSLTNLLIREGYNTVYCDNAQAYTIVPTTTKQYLKQQRRWKRSWIIYTAKTLKYIFKRDPFIAITYLFPQLIMNYLAPVLIFHTILIVTFSPNSFPLLYIIGLFALYAFYIIYFSAFRQDRYRPYILIWGAINVFLCSIIFPYAIVTLRGSKWGTR